MSRKERVCLVNAHWSNHGDEAAIVAIIRLIREIKPEAEILLLIKDKQEIMGEIQVDGQKVLHESIQFLPDMADYIVQLVSNGVVGRNKKMKRMFWHLGKADYIIYAPGGSVINDRFWWKKQMEYLLPVFYSIKKQKPFYVASPSIGPFEQKYRIRNRIRRYVFNHTENFYVREQMSLQYLEAICAAKTVQTTVDSAFCDTIDPEKQKTVLLRDIELCDFLDSYQKVIGMTITELEWNIKYRSVPELEQSIRRSARGFVDRLAKEDVGVVLIPQLFGNQNDKNLLSNYVAENTFLLNENYDSDFQQYLISQLYMVVGFRYHSNIFAAIAGIPFLPVVYEEKMESFVEEAGLSRYALAVEDIDADMLYEKYALVDSEYSKYKLQLEMEKKRWMKGAAITKKSIAEFLMKYTI